jgi:hypothetical protein
MLKLESIDLAAVQLDLEVLESLFDMYMYRYSR